MDPQPWLARMQKMAVPKDTMTAQPCRGGPTGSPTGWYTGAAIDDRGTKSESRCFFPRWRQAFQWFSFNHVVSHRCSLQRIRWRFLAEIFVRKATSFYEDFQAWYCWLPATSRYPDLVQIPAFSFDDQVKTCWDANSTFAGGTTTKHRKCKIV